MAIFLIAIGALAATFLGGSFALRFKDKLHLILGFSAGAVIGVAFFDLLPEATELAGKSYETETIFSFVALGFIIYMILDRLILFHGHQANHCENTGHSHAAEKRGIVGAASLSLHSFLDGAAIGLALKVSPAVGAIVTVAVLIHDFSDGINTVNLVLRSGGSRRRALKWLLADSLAPVAGIIFTQFFTVAEATLGLILALFGGFFLYIGASDLLPESHHAHPVRLTTVMTILGVAVLYAAIRLAGM